MEVEDTTGLQASASYRLKPDRGRPFMDPRRELEEKLDRIRFSKVPFIRKSREIALEEQMLGGPLEREIIVIRIDKAYLKSYILFTAYLIVLILISIFFGSSE